MEKIKEMSFEEASFKYEEAKRQLKKYKERLDYLYELQYKTLDEFGKQLKLIERIENVMRVQGRKEEMARQGYSKKEIEKAVKEVEEKNDF